MKKRKMPFHITVMGALLSWLGSVWPTLASYLAYNIWFSTPRYKESRREKVWRELATTETLIIAGKKIVVYKWGASTPGYVLLLHGWSGRGPQLGAFINPINRQGLAVISFDAPGHGASEGNKTTIFEIINVVSEVVKKYGVPHAIIAHSFGCMTAALAIRQYKLSVPRLVTISCPTDSRYLVDGFAIHFRLNEKVMSRFNQRLIKEFGEDLYVKTAADENLKQAPINLLVIHDQEDGIVSWHQSEKLARAVPGAKTFYTQKLGHQRLLRDDKVLERVSDFIFEE